MVRIVLNIDGMACGMCESHVNDTVRRQFSVKKVTSSYKKGKTEILAEQPLDEAALKAAIEATGYLVTGISTEQEVQKKFHLFGR